MTLDEARANVAAHDTDAKLLSRKPKYELVAIYQSELAGRGAQSLTAGRYSKDELIHAILDERFGWTRYLEARDIISADSLGMTVEQLVAARGC